MDECNFHSSIYIIGLYRENAVAIESEASDSLTYYRRIDQSGFLRKERNLHCDVHVTAKNKHTLPPPFGSLDSFWITRSQRSRRRDRDLLWIERITREGDFQHVSATVEANQQENRCCINMTLCWVLVYYLANWCQETQANRLNKGITSLKHL